MSVEEAEVEDDADALVAEMIGDNIKTTTRGATTKYDTATNSTTNTATTSTTPGTALSEISVVFPYIFMDSVVAALAATSGERDWTIVLPHDLEIDDVILELRRGVSDKADVSFKSVSLVLHDKPITLAMDIPAGG